MWHVATFHPEIINISKFCAGEGLMFEIHDKPSSFTMRSFCDIYILTNNCIKTKGDGGLATLFAIT